MPINKHTLDNGITLISEPVAATKAAAIGFWFYTGSRDETGANSGITHFIEHMLFKGTNACSARDIARFFDRTGGYVNAFTDREIVCLYAVVPGSAATASIRMMVEMLVASSFRNEDIETERSVIESEILSYLDDPEESCAEWFMETSFAGAGLSMPIAGTVESVSAIRPCDLRRYHAEIVMRRLECVTLSGSFDENPCVRELEALPPANDGPSARRIGEPSSIWVPGTRVKKTRFNQSQIVAGWKLPPIKTTVDWFEWSAINDILSDTVSSRLFREMREERGLCYSLSGSVNVFRDFSFLGVNLSVPPEKTRESVETLNEYTAAFFQKGPTEREVSDAREREIGAITLASEDPEYRMKRLARQFFREGRVQGLERDLAAVRQWSTEALLCRLSSVACQADQALCVYAPGKYGKSLGRSR